MTTPAKIILEDFIGKKFGRLTVLGAGGRNVRGIELWRCICECACGTEISVSKYQIKSGSKQSCGCLRRELARQRFFKHGMTVQGGKRHHTTRTYRIWVAMRTRCNNHNQPGYCNWGGRGIKVCSEWDDFSVFLRDMGECPAGQSIDRYPNNDGNYEKGNCRWATALEQRMNQRLRTHCPQGHPYAGDIDYRGRQFCRLCKNAHDHRQRAHRKQRKSEALDAAR